MTKLSDTQAVIFANASQSFDGNLLPLPGSLRGGAQAKVIGALLKRGLIEERTIDSIQPPDASLNRVWRQDDDGRAILLYITKAGLAAIGCEPEDADAADTAPDGATDAQDASAGRGGRHPGRRRTRGRHDGGRRLAERAKGPRRHQAGAADRDAPQPRRRQHRGDRRRQPAGSRTRSAAPSPGR